MTDLPDEMFRARPDIEIERYTSERRFTGKAEPRPVSLLFDPAAMVDPMSYDPLARRVAGLVLVGTTHPRDFDLSTARFPVTKILASRDGVAPVAQSRAKQGLLPPATRFVMIEGGNHAQFGYYRYQLFDGEAIISREEQQQQLTRAMLAALEEIEKKPQ